MDISVAPFNFRKVASPLSTSVRSANLVLEGGPFDGHGHYVDELHGSKEFYITLPYGGVSCKYVISGVRHGNVFIAKYVGYWCKQCHSVERNFACEQCRWDNLAED